MSNNVSSDGQWLSSCANICHQACNGKPGKSDAKVWHCQQRRYHSWMCHVGVEGCRIHHKHLPQHWLTPFSQLSGGCRIFRASLGLRGTCTRINLTHKPEAPFKQGNLGITPCKSTLGTLVIFCTFLCFRASVLRFWVLDFEAKLWSHQRLRLSLQTCAVAEVKSRLSCFLVFLFKQRTGQIWLEKSPCECTENILTKTNAAKGRLVLLDMRGMANCKTVNLLPNLSKQVFLLGHSLSSVKATMCN